MHSVVLFFNFEKKAPPIIIKLDFLLSPINCEKYSFAYDRIPSIRAFSSLFRMTIQHKCDIEFIHFQADGEKRIELKPGFYMEHDENV